MEPVLLIDKHDGWVKLTLNRPKRLNAFNAALHGALARSLEDAADDVECRAIVLTGAGKGFCAGQDLNDRNVGDAPIDLGASIDAFYNPLVRRLRSLPKPIVCAVNGVAAGAGANLAIACDIVVASRSARFVQSFTRLGLIPDTGGTYALPRLVGDARARALTMLGEPLDAETAASWGLIWKVVDDQLLGAETERLAAQLAGLPPQGVALTKEALNASAKNDLPTQLDLERDLQRKAGNTSEYREAVRAFIERRTAAPQNS